MVDVKALKAEIVRNGYTQEEFCKTIGMAHSTFIRKMRKKTMTTDEAERIIKVLNIENPTSIFFAKQLT